MIRIRERKERAVKKIPGKVVNLPGIVFEVVGGRSA
jgi:hypothetical protein